MSSQWGAYASASAGLNPGVWGRPRAPSFPLAATCPTVAWSGELHGPQPQMPRLSCTVWNPPPPTNVIWKPFENRRYIGNFPPCNSGPAPQAVQSLGSKFSDSNMAVHNDYYSPVSSTPPPGFHQAMGRNEFVPACSYPHLSIEPPPPAPAMPPFHRKNTFDDPVSQPLSQRWEFMVEPWKRRRRGRRRRGRNKEFTASDDGMGGGDGVGGGVSMGSGDGGDVGSLAAGANTAGQFVCEPCSKEYKTEETYRAHVSSHKKCTTCDFMAVPRVLKEHELMHILPPELKFTSPDEIRSWREKRKKNYPTTANVAKKRRLAADRQARGEVAETPLYKYVSHLIGEDIVPASGGGGRGRGGRKRRPMHPLRRLRKRRRLRYQQDSINNESTFITPDDDIEGLDGFQGGDTLAPVEEEEGYNGTSFPTLEASNGEHVDAGDSVQSEHGEIPNLGGASGENLLGAIMADASSQQARRQSAQKRKRWRKPRRRMQQKSKSKRKDRWVVLSEVGERKPTLLEKLLAPEIRKEQNAILQCIRHTVQENFFMPPVTGSRNEQGSQDGETSNSEAKEQAQVLDEATVDGPPRIKVEDGTPGEERERGWLLSKDRSDDVEDGAPAEEREGGWLPSKDRSDDVEDGAPGEEREGGWLPSKDRSDDVEDGAPGEEREGGWLPSKDRSDDVEDGAPGEEREGGWLPSKDRSDDVGNIVPGEEREGGWLLSKDRSDDQEQSNTENLYWIDQQGRSPRSP